MPMFVVRAAWAVFLILIAGLATAQERRVALIVGNDSYRAISPLNNAVADARAMDKKLKELGFETILRTNAGRIEMNRAVTEFGRRIGTPDTVGLVFYSGHGIQAFDRNWLIPIDASLESEDDLQAEAIDAQRILTAMDEARNPLNIVILDACRDNPLPKKGRSAARGLAVVSAAPRGSIVAYSASPNQKADDGVPGGNGVYTAELLKALDEPGLSIEQVFKHANGGVQRAAGGRQIPWFNASIQGDFYFRRGGSSPTTTATTAPAATPAPPSQGPTKEQIELVFWESIKTSTNPADYKAYLERYPNGLFAALARNHIGRPATSTPVAVRGWVAVDKGLVLKEVTVNARRKGEAYNLEVSGIYPPETKAPGKYIDFWTARWDGKAWNYSNVKGKIAGSWAPGERFNVSFDIPLEYLDDPKGSNVRLCLDAGTGCWPSPNLVVGAN
jgi:hypothetical protein